MTELGKGKKKQRKIERLMQALGEDAQLRDRMRSNPAEVLDDFGLSKLIPEGAQLVVEVDDPSPAARVAVDDTKPTHLDLAHIDKTNPWPDPLPPTHFDWAHTDAVLLQRNDTPITRLRIRPGSPG